MSPVFLVSVIDFLMSPALDTAHDGADFSFSKHFQIPGLIVRNGLFFTDSSMHSFMEGSLSTLLPPPPPLPLSQALVVVCVVVVCLLLFF